VGEERKVLPEKRSIPVRVKTVVYFCHRYHMLEQGSIRNFPWKKSCISTGSLSLVRLAIHRWNREIRVVLEAKRRFATQATPTRGFRSV